jgi:hypothetical protein
VNARDLIGTWRLHSLTNNRGDGSVTEPFGANPVGYLFYNHDGYMSVEIMAAPRAPHQGADVLGSTLEDRSPAISPYLSYCGPFEVVGDQDAVIHHVEVCSNPKWVGSDQFRFAKIDGSRLTLSTKPMSFQGIEQRSELVWERVGQD